MMSDKGDETETGADNELLKCRTCLQELCANSVIIDLFQTWVQPLQGIESIIAEELVKLANIQINRNDIYPKVICESCCLKLQSACEFVSSVRKSDSVLRKRNLDYVNKICPKPIQVDNDIVKTGYENVLGIEIKQECMDNNRRENCRSNDLAMFEIKIEPEEFIQEHENMNENHGSDVEMTDMHAQCCFYKLGTSETNKNVQITKNKCDITIENQKDQNTLYFKHFGPDRIENKAAAAERSRLYRERHRKEINQRRREIRKHHQKLYQINTASMDEFEQYSADRSNKKLNSHTRRQRRYYQRHRDEINQRRRDQRLKQNISRSVPATAAERNRKYRERKKQEINERRRKSRQCKQKLQETQAECNTNDMDRSEQITKAKLDHIQDV